MPQLREAVVEDAREIAEVHVRSWQVAYRGMFPDAFLNGLSDSISDRVAWREGMLRSPTPRSATLVASSGGTVVGFVDTSSTRDRDLDPSRVGEVLAIYVSPSQWGRGVGRLLIVGAEQRLREHGYDEATLWVLSQNRRARRFYEGAGWEHDGFEKTDQFGGNQVTEVRYRKSLV